MARRPARKSAPKAGRAAGASAASPPIPPDGSDREKIIAAFLGLLAEKRFEQIGLAEIAQAAGVSLAQFRDEFASPLSILAAHIKDTDRAVLAADFSDMAEEPPRERLFDVLMRRLEILAPHREAVRSLLALGIAQSAARDCLQRACGAVAAMDAHGGRDRLGRPARHGARAGARAPVRVGAADLGQRRRSGPGANHGSARPGAGPRPALCRPVRGSCSLCRGGCAGCGRAGAGIPTTIPKRSPLRNRGTFRAAFQVQT